MCCIINEKTKNKKNVSAIDKLKKHFDIVEVVEKEDYDVLECKNISKSLKAGCIKFETWINLKIKKNRIESFGEEVLAYIDKLLNFKDNSKATIQKTLFEDEEVTKKITINDLSFWQLVNDYFIFDYDDYINEIPKTNEEMIEVVKECLTLYTDNPTEEFHHFNFDDDYSYFRTTEPISDREMLSRLYSSLRIHFGISTYVEDRYSVDLSNEVRTLLLKDEKNKRFHASYYGANYVIDLFNGKSKVYDLYEKDFCIWLRKLFNIPYRKPIEDDEVIKESIINFAEKFFDKEDTLDSFISSSKNAIDFRKKVFSFLREKSSNLSSYSGGGGGPLDDCYSTNYSYEINELELIITQLNSYRIQLGRQIVQNDDVWKKDSTCILNLKGNEVFEGIYIYLSSKPTYKQATLF